MGAQSTVGRSFIRAREQTSTPELLAPCAIEGCVAGGCSLWIPAPTSNRSLRFSNQPHFPFGNCPPIFETSPFHQSARRDRSHFPLCRPVQVAQRPRFPFWELTRIPVHGYDTRTSQFPSVASKGRTHESSPMRHGVPPHGSPHSMAFRPPVTVQGGLTRARRRER